MTDLARPRIFGRISGWLWWLEARPTWFVAATISLSLAVEFGGFGIIAAYLFVKLLATRLGSIREAIDGFRRNNIGTPTGNLYVVFILLVLATAILILVHGDKTSIVEPRAKQLLIAFVILYQTKGISWRAIATSAAAAAIVALIVATYQYLVLDVARPGSVTNPIRFGMLAILFASLALTGFTEEHHDRARRLFLGAGVLSGIAATILSGSRGAFLAFPVLIFILLSAESVRAMIRRRPLAVAVIIAALVALFISTPVYERSREAVSTIITHFQATAPLEETVRDRVVMLEMSWSLFADHPVFGVGQHGWNAAVSRQMESTDPATVLRFPYNQPHNQFANDFAKGGLLGGLAGMALLLVPLIQFTRASLVGHDPAARLGMVTCLLFAIFCITESVMILSVTACIYATLVCSLMTALRSDSHRPALEPGAG